jgi:hypothetical protein
MERYKIITLVDITRSEASRDETNKIKLGQQANFNTLLQTIGLRSNIEWLVDPKMEKGRIPYQDGKANHWVWEFETEREQVFKKLDDPVGLLVDDIHGVPVVNQLNNTVELNPSTFVSKGNNTNIWIYRIN